MQFPESINNRLRSLPLPVALVLPFVAQMVVAISLVGYLSYRNGHESVNLAIDQLQREVVDRVDDLLRRTLDELHDTNARHAMALQGGQLTLGSGEQIDQFFWQTVKQQRNVTFSGIALPDGQTFGAERDQRDLMTIRRKGAGELFCTYGATDRGERQFPPFHCTPNFDPRKRPWYRSSIAAGQPVWSPIYPHTQGQTAYLGAVQPVWTVDRQLLGVLLTNINLSAFSRILGQIQGNKPGQVFVLDRSGQLVANSTGEPVVARSNRAFGARQLAAVNSRDPLMAAAARRVMQELRVSDLFEDRQLLIELDRQYFGLYIRPFRDDRGLDWLLVAVMPQAAYSGALDQNLWVTIAICGVVIGLLGCTGWLTARWLTRPIEEVYGAARELARGQWSRRVTGGQRLDRLGDLARAFNFMADCVEGSFAQLTAQNQELRKLDRLKDEFLASTSHELRSPLAGAIGVIESLLQGSGGTLNAVQTRNFELLLTTHQRLHHLVSDLLDLSRLRYGDLQLESQPIDLRSATQVACTVLRPLADRKDLDLIIDIPSTLPPVMADPYRLQQILINLIDNAIQFTTSGSITLSAEYDSQTDLTCVQLSDTGCGTNIQQLQRLLDGPTMTGGTAYPYGMGLGLTITKRLVELHGGSLSVRSRVGGGTVFQFTLPIAWMRNQQTMHPQSSPSLLNWSVPELQLPALPVDAPSHSARVLVVDDDALVLQGIANWLTLEPGFQVTVATSGQSALEQLNQAEPPDLVLLDVLMPGCTGYEVLEQLRQTRSPQDLPVILMCDRTRPADIVAGFAAGANDYLKKPINQSELLARVRAHLTIRALEIENRRVAAEHEQRLALFLDALPVGVAVYQANGELLYVNSLGQQLLEPDADHPFLRDVPLGDRLYLAGSDRRYPHDRWPCQMAMAGQPFVTEDIEIDCGVKRLPCEVRAVPIQNGKGEVDYAVVAFQDITERRKTAQILQDYSRSLETEVAARTAALIHTNQQLQIQVLERQRAEESLRLLNQELARLAQLDGLTQLANRRCFDEHLAQEWMRMLRSNQPLSLILLDVDCFKAYNDRYGHPSGDRCLIEVARVLSQVARRPADLVARYGGEEFVLILPDTPLEGAITVAIDVRSQVRACQIPHERSIAASIVTVSLGVTCVMPGSGSTPDRAIALADMALYEAKHSGRDRYCVKVPGPVDSTAPLSLDLLADPPNPLS
ncbi:MAG: diguanylate cyclase [Oscillatoriales cyanobacterium]|nr:MAG: diguanylate cyclase [Oscillatoriales cyanobacterium]